MIDSGGVGSASNIERTFAYTFHGADLCIIFHGMDGEVNLRKRFLLLDGANRIVDLLRAAILAAGRAFFHIGR